LKDQIEQKIQEKKRIREGGFLSGTNNTKKDELNSRNADLKEVRDTKNDLGRKLKDLHS